MSLRKTGVLAFTVLTLFAESALSQGATRLDRLSAEEYSQVKDKKGIVLLAVNWSRRWGCAGYENAQLRSLGFDRLPITKAADDAPPDMLLDDAPLLLTRPVFDGYAFVVEPGEYALSGFVVKGAKSVRDIGEFKATRSHLIKDGKALGSFEVREGEIIYIGHFFLECHRQPILWRYYLKEQDAFKKYLEAAKSKFPALDIGKAQFRLLRTIDFGNDYHTDIGGQAEASGNWRLAEENYERALAELSTASVPDAYRSMTMYNLGRARGYACKFDEAEKLLSDALRLEEKVSGPESGITSMRLFELGRLHLDRGEFEKSALYFGRGMATATKLGVEKTDPIAFAASFDDYATALKGMGRNADADAAKKEADRIRAANPGSSARFIPARYNQSCPTK
jgi:tetratricopeptide (TPR) repeat protein